MTTLPGVRVIHSYDTELHRVRCGVTEQSNSTKHARDVTCEDCRDLLDRARPARSAPAVASVASVDPSGP